MTINQSGVRRQRKELIDIQAKYSRINDALSGEEAVKAGGAKYLPIPSACDEKGIYDPRYVAYQTRALYYNVCQPTRDALVGQLFLRPPVVEIPDALKKLTEDMNGEGLNLEQLIKKAANYVLPYGRGGFLADFPTTGGEVTKAEVDSGTIRPIIRFFEPWAIRNWQITKEGTTKKLTMLVLDEMTEKVNGEDKFHIELEVQHRVYTLVNEQCSVQVFDKDGKPLETYTIKGSDGKPLDSIPFEFIGSENNDADIDEPPFLNLANINLAHFRNSADYEEGCFLCGQPTPVYAGLTEDWMANWFPKGIPFGSRASVTLNEGATAQLLQALPNMVAFEAMKHKEDQMFSIGAKIINRDQKVEKKQAEVEIEAASQKSVLTTIKDNLQMALFACIQRAGMFVGVEVTKENSKLELNENFDLTSMNPDEMRSVSELYTGGLIGFSEMRETLRRSGIAKLSDDEAKKAVLEDKKLKESLMPPEPVNPTNPAGKKTATKKVKSSGPQN